MPSKTASKAQNRVAKLIAEVEAAAKQLRKDVQKRAVATGSELQKTANQLRKRAATVAAAVEKQVHQLRKDLEKGTKRKRRAPKRKARRS